MPLARSRVTRGQLVKTATYYDSAVRVYRNRVGRFTPVVEHDDGGGWHVLEMKETLREALEEAHHAAARAYGGGGGGNGYEPEEPLTRRVGQGLRVKRLRYASRRRGHGDWPKGYVSPTKGYKVVSMYQEAKVYINGRYQVGFTFGPHRGPEEAARTVMGITPSGGVIKVKQGRYVWTYKVTGRGIGRMLKQINLTARERAHEWARGR